MGTVEVKDKEIQKRKRQRQGLVLCNTSPIDVKMVTMIYETTMQMMTLMSLSLDVTQPILIKNVMVKIIEILMSFI